MRLQNKNTVSLIFGCSVFVPKGNKSTHTIAQTQGPCPPNPFWTKTRILVIVINACHCVIVFLPGLISGLTKEKYDATLLFALARVMMAQPQWPANSQASLQHCSKRMSVGLWRTQNLAKEGGHPPPVGVRCMHACMTLVGFDIYDKFKNNWSKVLAC